MPQLPLKVKVKAKWFSSLHNQGRARRDKPVRTSLKSSPHARQSGQSGPASSSKPATSQPTIRVNSSPPRPPSRVQLTPTYVPVHQLNVDKTDLHHRRSQTSNSKLSNPLQPHRVNSPMEVERFSRSSRFSKGGPNRDTKSMSRILKVHDNDGFIIPAHKGTELTYDQRVLGSFGIDLREKIGEGVYAKVRLGVDLFSGKPEEQSKLAIKIIDKEKVTSRFIENFLDRELAVWSKLSHTGITQFYYYTVTPRKVYMVLEYLTGGDLLTYVQNLKNLPEKQEITCWTWQLISAIEYIHSIGAAHRDIKLENILMEAGSNRLKLTDFGFSTDDTSRLSTTFCGSKAYAAPELIRAVPYSPQAVDVWAMGCVFFVLVNGIMAFDETVEQSVLLYNQRNRVYLWRNPRNHSPTAKRVIEKMLTCDWKLRPTATQLMKDAWIRKGALHCRTLGGATITIAPIDFDPKDAIPTGS